MVYLPTARSCQQTYPTSTMELCHGKNTNVPKRSSSCINYACPARRQTKAHFLFLKKPLWGAATAIVRKTPWTSSTLRSQQPPPTNINPCTLQTTVGAAGVDTPTPWTSSFFCRSCRVPSNLESSIIVVLLLVVLIIIKDGIILKMILFHDNNYLLWGFHPYRGQQSRFRIVLLEARFSSWSMCACMRRGCWRCRTRTSK
ncbi:hypothetical protein B0H63DRAFT_290102 [Podospora didyma]|uniref:Uncharacterized protein n=1 Tax=Podospora didyma TaxID=330526 RepID=A0AAE0K8S1_9PEZI|nr:hypothetical protein B0H63DRAFT_290102 [Podospora didyma]